MFRFLLGCVLVVGLSSMLIADAGQDWSSTQYKCSFRLPDANWKNTTDGKLGVLKDGVVEFMSFSDYSIISMVPFTFTTDEQWKAEVTRKTVDTTQSMIRAFSDRVWLIREEPSYLVNGVPGYKREIGYQIGGIDYTAIIVVLIKNNMHYRILFTSLEKNYSTSFSSFLKIIGSFKISE